MTPTPLVRLNKYLGNIGVCSRRAADDYIAAGRVLVNGKRAVLGSKIDPQQIRAITIDGESINCKRPPLTYIMLNKPAGYTVTKGDRHAEKTVMDLLPDALQQLYPIGRLDQNSAGLLLLTNDGDFAEQIMHPRFQHEKEYLVTTRQSLSQPDLRTLSNGIQLEEGNTGRAKVRQLDHYTFTIILHQGWKRQIRRMLKVLNHQVVSLQRLRIGKLTLGNLPLGKWQIISKEQVC